MTNSTTYVQPVVRPTEEAAILGALRSGWVTPLGPGVDAFEGEPADPTGRARAVALSSGKAALHLALPNLGVNSEAVALTAKMTFAATANVIVYAGARPVFVVYNVSGNMSLMLDLSLLDSTKGFNGVSWRKSTPLKSHHAACHAAAKDSMTLERSAAQVPHRNGLIAGGGASVLSSFVTSI